MLNTNFPQRGGPLVALLLFVMTLLPVASVNAQSEEYIAITHPLAGAVIESGTTIFFSPGTVDVYQWRVTIGPSPSISGIYDSGVRLFDEEPWELVVSGLPSNGKPVTLRFWQRPSDGSGWVSTDTVFNTRSSSEASPEDVRTPVTSTLPETIVVPETSAFDASSDNAAAPLVTLSISREPTDVLSGGSGAVEDSSTVSFTEETVIQETAVRNTVDQSQFLLKVANNGPVVSSLRAEHRNGQTFLTWKEVRGDAGYHVYRSTSPITSSNIRNAEKLTGKWGPLDSDTSVNKHAHGSIPVNYIIKDLDQPLGETDGLFVNTPSNSGAAYYAVTAVSGGRENIAVKPGKNSLSEAVSETVAEPKPVLAVSTNKGKGRLYIQYMDYANWNPTFNGYAYNYSITLPVGYKKSHAYPLLVRPHAYGEPLPFKKESEYGWQVIQLFPQDPSRKHGSIVHSWWYGYAAEHNYLTDGPIPKSGHIANFTESRVMKAVKDTIDDPEINIDTQLVHAFGHSMGASGSLAFAIRYGNVFAGMYGNEAMSNYTTSPKFHNEWEKLWGTQSDNLPIVSRGHYTNLITRYDGTGVWDWMNHHKQMVDRRGDRMAFLMLSHGKADTVVDWETQGAPMARVFNEASVGYSSRYIEDATHAWLGFTAVVNSLFGFGRDVNFPWRYPLSLSFPAIANASGSGPLLPGPTQTDDYNLDIEWATPHTNFAKSIVDQPNRYEISLRSKSSSQTADITPRNPQQFAVNPGDQCGWVAVDSNKRATVGSGTVTVDEDGLVTIPKMLITPKKGTRLAIECS